MARAPAVRMYVEHFGREVVIDADHPLAVAQRAMDAKNAKAASRKGSESAVPADTPKAIAPAASASPDSSSSFSTPAPAVPAVPAEDPRRMNADALRARCAERHIAVPEGATRKVMIALLAAA